MYDEDVCTFYAIHYKVMLSTQFSLKMVNIFICIRHVAAGAKICDFFVELWANMRQIDDVTL